MSTQRSPMAQFARSSGTMGLLYLGSTGLTFAVGVLLARLLGASQYGTYALAMTSATLAGLITEFGLPTLAMREVGVAQSTGRWGEVSGLLRWAQRLILLLSLGLFVAFVVARNWVPAMQSSSYLAAMLWGVVLIPTVASGRLRALVLLALDCVLASQLPVMILRPLLFILGCLAVWAITGSLDAPTAMAVQVFGAAVALLVILLLFARVRPAALADAVPVYRARVWLATCLPMGLTEGLRLLQGQFALLLTGALAGAGAAGTYRVADAVSQMTGLAASVVATAATPLFSRLNAAQDREALERVAILSAWATLGGYLALGLVPALAGHWLFPWIFGADFAPSATVFVILWIGMVVSSLGGLALALANMTGHHVLSTQSFGVIVVSNLVLGSALIPPFGAAGAASAAGISSVAGTAFCAIRLRKVAGINSTLIGGRAFGILREGISAVVKRVRG